MFLHMQPECAHPSDTTHAHTHLYCKHIPNNLSETCIPIDIHVHINTILYRMRSTGIQKQTETRDIIEVIQRQIVAHGKKETTDGAKEWNCVYWSQFNKLHKRIKRKPDIMVGLISEFFLLHDWLLQKAIENYVCTAIQFIPGGRCTILKGSIQN